MRKAKRRKRKEKRVEMKRGDDVFKYGPALDLKASKNRLGASESSFQLWQVCTRNEKHTSRC
jgi:hypothetical protein